MGQSSIDRRHCPDVPGFRLDEENLAPDEWLLEPVVVTRFEDRIIKNARGRVISKAGVVKGKIGAGSVGVRCGGVPVDDRVRGLQTRLMRIVRMKGGQQRQPQEGGDRPDGNGESDVS